MTTTFERPTTEQPPPPRTGKRRRRIVIGVGVVVVLALVGTWLVAFSSVFGVRTVQVRGAHVLTVTQVLAAADVTDGTPLVRLDTAAITRRVERLPDVASAEVSTSFPSTVLITIDERTPVGYVVSHGRDMLVDRTGDQYRAVASHPKGLPKFVVPAGTDARTTGGAVATVASALPKSLRPAVRSIEALDPNAITLVLTHARVVRWGSADRSGEKARLLPALLARHPDQVDLTDPDQPFTR